MNGRLYDPYLQRFLSPDPFVQSPNNAQNYNRYTYCLNNPLMYTDPTGYNQQETFDSNAKWSDIGYKMTGSSPLWFLLHGTSQSGKEGYTYVGNGKYIDKATGAVIPEAKTKRHKDTWEIDDIIDYYLNGVEDKEHYMFTKYIWKRNTFLNDNSEDNEPSSQGDPTVILNKYYSYDPNSKNVYNGLGIILNVIGKQYSEYNWVQTCSINGQPAFSDPKGMPNNGFYYSDIEISDYKITYPSYDGYFDDYPRTADGTGQIFELTLVGKTGNTWSSIFSYSYGYTVNNGKTSLIPFQQISNPSSTHSFYLNLTLFYYNH